MTMISSILCSLYIYSAVTSHTLPDGFGEAVWGNELSQLKSKTNLHKAAPGSEYSYADHMEKNPDVYVTKNDKQRIEYYFFKRKLYKVFIIYPRNSNNEGLYRQLITENIAKYGKPTNQYQEKVFGLAVLHTVWTDGKSDLDIRSGAGYIYQVRSDKKAAAAKRLLQQFRHAI